MGANIVPADIRNKFAAVTALFFRNAYLTLWPDFFNVLFGSIQHGSFLSFSFSPRYSLPWCSGLWMVDLACRIFKAISDEAVGHAGVDIVPQAQAIVRAPSLCRLQ